MTAIFSPYSQPQFGAIRFSPALEAKNEANPKLGFMPLAQVKTLMNSQEAGRYSAPLILDKLGYDVYVQEYGDEANSPYLSHSTQVKILKKGTDEVAFDAGFCNRHPQNDFEDFNSRLFEYGFLMLAKLANPALADIIKPLK